MNTYTVKQVEHVPDGMPSWAIYQVCQHGHRTALCLCYTEEIANTVVRLFELAIRTADAFQDDDDDQDDQVDDDQADNTDPGRSARDGRAKYPAWPSLR